MRPKKIKILTSVLDKLDGVIADFYEPEDPEYNTLLDAMSLIELVVDNDEEE